jgi:hypothetical protein
MYLTVPLPIAQHRTVKFIYVPFDAEETPMKISLLIPQNASFMQLKEKLALLVKCNPANVCLLQTHRSDIGRTNASCSSLASISGKAQSTPGGTTQITTRSSKTPMWQYSTSFLYLSQRPANMSGLPRPITSSSLSTPTNPTKADTAHRRIAFLCHSSSHSVRVRHAIL